jgi:hypothetical protein
LKPNIELIDLLNRSAMLPLNICESVSSPELQRLRLAHRSACNQLRKISAIE